jgi:hypothetical protein
MATGFSRSPRERSTRSARPLNQIVVGQARAVSAAGCAGHADEQTPRVIDSLSRAVAGFIGLRIQCRRVRATTGRPTSPKRLSRSVRPLAGNGPTPWALRFFEARNRWPSSLLAIDDRLRKYSALCWRSPQQWFVKLFGWRTWCYTTLTTASGILRCAKPIRATSDVSG